MSNGYEAFLESKAQGGTKHGFDPIWLHDDLFDFQRGLVEWALRKGRDAIFADCGLGKTLMQLVWADNIVRKTNKPVLVLTPLAVGMQTVQEGVKFGVECVRCRDGKFSTDAKIIVTNYERLHYFNSGDFAGVVCDESSILKNFDGQTKAAITEFMRTRPYRLLCTATAAPNDYIELGTSSEALGEMGFADMLGRFFKKENRAMSRGGEYAKGVWRFRGHAERDFWRWVCSWARAVRRPSDMGCDDGPFVLPALNTEQHIIKASRPQPGVLFDLPAVTLAEQREERRRTLPERCECAASIVNGTSEPCVAWCHLNDEGDTLAQMIPDAVQVAGKDPDEFKEEALGGFVDGSIRVLVTKPTIAGHGMNWQHCRHQTFFPSHSFEQWYQAVRRSWRFGQDRPVTVDVITSEGEASVLENLQRKSEAATVMFDRLVQHMNQELAIRTTRAYTTPEEVPSWVS